MPDRPIVGEEARQYISNVGQHGLSADTQWLIDVGRFPVGCHVLDVGCGTGTLVRQLAADKRFVRSVIGIELSPELAAFAGQSAGHAGAMVIESNFLDWHANETWRPDTLVMSFFLHHCDDISQHLSHAASLLPHGGRLYVFDRIAVSQAALDAFPLYWDDRYRAAHEWHEEMPRLVTAEMLIDELRIIGFDFVRQTTCPHDNREGTKGFPKTLMEFWRHESAMRFPAVLVVSPAHGEYINDIMENLASADLQVGELVEVDYSDELIRTIYERCPWRESLLKFVAEVCPGRKATALRFIGDNSKPDMLDRLAQFKRNHRDRWQSIAGPADANGFQAIILPFHVAEPYEAEALADVVGCVGKL